MKKYELTEEHRAQLKPWAEKWIENAMSTKPMDEHERAICREAVKVLYRSAKLEPPPDQRIVFVPSPFVLRFASGFAAAIWYLQENEKNYSKFDAYEKLAIHSGPRIMHEKFCMISDRPRVLKVDSKNRPHCDTGPFCEWSDGAAMYALHGVRMPMWVVEAPSINARIRGAILIGKDSE